MARLTLDQLFDRPQLKEQTVTIEEIGGDVLLRELTAQQLQNARDESKNQGNTRAGKAGTINQAMFEKKLVAYCLVEPKIDPVADMGKLMAMPQSLFMRILRESMKINGLNEEAQQEAEKTFPEDEGADHAGAV
jgi:hypothetical protein